MKNLLYAASLFFLLMIVGCKGNKSGKIESTREESPFVHEDTVLVHSLVSTYLDDLKDQNFEHALFLLYHIDDDIVYNLTDYERNGVKELWKIYPVTEYTIDSICLYKKDSCRAYYSLKLFDKPEDDPIPNTMQFVLAPHLINGTWYLTLLNESKPLD